MRDQPEAIPAGELESAVDRAMTLGLCVSVVDPPGAGTRARAYRVHLQPTLWGELDVIREWGRLDHLRRPRQLATACATEVEARAVVRQVVERRWHRGYR